MSKTSGGLKPAILKRLSNIFVLLDWQLTPESEFSQPYNDIFDSFSQLLSLLDDGEQELVLRLTEDYLHCTYFQYPKLLERALSQIPDELIEESEVVLIIPLQDPTERDKIKSAEQMLYGPWNLALSHLPVLAAKSPKVYRDPGLLMIHKKRKRSLILLVDDFIGTGKTAEAALADYNARLKLTGDVPIVVSLVAQEEGIERIEALGCSVVTAHVRRRGISDNGKIIDKPKAMEIIKSIEKRVPIDPSYSLGYKQSEALVSMIKTPDNTLPIYWCSGLDSTRPWPAPFPRP